MAVVYINYNMCADLDCCVLYQRLFAITKAKSLLLLFEVGVYLTCSFTSLFLHSSVQSSSMCMFCSFCIHLSSPHPCVCFVLSGEACVTVVSSSGIVLLVLVLQFSMFWRMENLGISEG